MCGKDCPCKQDFDKAAEKKECPCKTSTPAPETNDNAPAETPKKKDCACGGACGTKPKP